MTCGIRHTLRALARIPALAVLGAILLLGASNQADANPKTLTVVADEWPPFSGERLPGKGMSPDVIVQVLHRAGYQAKVAILPWARIMHGARTGTGNFDIVGSLFFDPELTELMTYSQPYVETDVRFVRRVGADVEFSGLDSLRPYSIAVGDGFLYEDKFDRASFLNKIVVTTALQGVQLVAAGRADLTLDSIDVVNYAVSVQDASLQGKVELIEGVLATHGVHMAVMRNVPNGAQIIADFNRALRDMRADGSLDHLIAKHRGG